MAERQDKSVRVLSVDLEEITIEQSITKPQRLKGDLL